MDLPLVIVPKKLPNTSSRVTVYYPAIIQMTDAKVQRELNHQIISALNTLLVDQNFYDENLVELISNFEIKNNERNILSLNLITYSYTGGAHGMTVVKSLTFDTTTGKLYSLKDLFKSNSNYVSIISDIIRKRIADWNIDLLDPPFKTIRSDQDFYIADTSLVIYFQLYEISPYASGFPYFPIPIKDLQHIIEPNSPLDRMIAFT
ncbi:DUF3298 and DUF4163 domain-containing protein [Sporosarcina contaminans]|uniref:DUF3298 and DUF4163 domain-containing protein n=1 Tax=Sporosarcina contaminans TaxID=633403 RepID=A0ABW3U392_9BACL